MGWQIRKGRILSDSQAAEEDYNAFSGMIIFGLAGGSVWLVYSLIGAEGVINKLILVGTGIVALVISMAIVNVVIVLIGIAVLLGLLALFVNQLISQHKFQIDRFKQYYFNVKRLQLKLIEYVSAISQSHLQYFPASMNQHLMQSSKLSSLSISAYSDLPPTQTLPVPSTPTRLMQPLRSV